MAAPKAAIAPSHGIPPATALRAALLDSRRRWRDAAALAAVLRRAGVIDQILTRMRSEVLAPRMMQAALEPLVHATGSEAAAVIDAVGGAAPVLRHAHGTVPATVLAAVLPVLEAAGGAPAVAVAADGRKLLVCLAQTRFGEQVGLLLCRAPGGPAWDANDRALGSAAGALVRVILEHEAIQREMARQMRTDPLTGLCNRRAFVDELARRLDRLDRDGVPGALLCLGLDGFMDLNDANGHDAGDAALRLTAQLLRGHTRPTDLVARLGGDGFAVWLDGADEFAAAERAEHLRAAGPAALAGLTGGRSPSLALSIGIAARWPGRGEDGEAVLNRADQAMDAARRAGRGRWRVAREEDAP